MLRKHTGLVVWPGPLGSAMGHQMLEELKKPRVCWGNTFAPADDSQVYPVVSKTLLMISLSPRRGESKVKAANWADTM